MRNAHKGAQKTCAQRRFALKQAILMSRERKFNRKNNNEVIRLSFSKSLDLSFSKSSSRNINLIIYEEC